MSYSFHIYGHHNITAKHKTTLEFTKDKEVTLRGDCIVGVKADFSLEKLRKFLSVSKILIKIKTSCQEEEIAAEVNPSFDHHSELVIRKSGFIDSRTFAIKADKAAIDLNRGIIEEIKKTGAKVSISKA